MNNPGQNESEKREFPVLILSSGMRRYRLMRTSDGWALDPHQLMEGDEEVYRRLSFGEARQLVIDWLDDAEKWSP